MAGASRARRPAGAQQRSPRGAHAPFRRPRHPLGRRSRLWRRFQPARARARPAASPALASRGPRRGASRRRPGRIARWGDTWEEAGADLRASRQGRDLTVAFQKADLVSDLEGVLEGAPHLVTAAALFDLVSAEWIRRLAAAVAAREAVFYTVLTYNGTESWSPAHPSDAAIRAAFHAHQGGDKGFGPAAGPAASERLAEAFLAAIACEARQPWRLGPRMPSSSANSRRAGKAVRETGEVGRRSRVKATRSRACVVGHRPGSSASSEMTKSRRGSKRAFQRPPASWGIPTCWPSPAETPRAPRQHPQKRPVASHEMVMQGGAHVDQHDRRQGERQGIVDEEDRLRLVHTSFPRQRQRQRDRPEQVHGAQQVEVAVQPLSGTRMMRR